MHTEESLMNRHQQNDSPQDAGDNIVGILGSLAGIAAVIGGLKLFDWIGGLASSIFSRYLEPVFKSLAVLLGVYWTTFAFGVGLVLAGFLLYKLRELNRKAYAILELLLAAGLGAEAPALFYNHLISTPGTVSISATDVGKLVSALYFAVRGLDNWFKGCDESSRTSGHTPLMVAAYRDEPTKIRRLIKTQTTLIDQAHPDSGMTPLMIAVKMNRERAVKELINQGADPTDGLKNKAGDGALKLAIKNENRNIIRDIEKGIERWNKKHSPSP